MREIYQQMVDESSPGRFEGESPMTAYVYTLLMDGNYGDEELRWNDGSSCVRFGKRILVCQSTGFIGLETCSTAEEAERRFTADRKQEVFEIIEQADDIGELFKQMTDESTSAYWMEEANVSEDDVATEIWDRVGPLLSETDYDRAYSNGTGVAWRLVRPSFLGYVRGIMVGDDRVHVLGTMIDITPLREDDWCGICGQIGCGWH